MEDFFKKKNFATQPNFDELEVVQEIMVKVRQRLI